MNYKLNHKKWILRKKKLYRKRKNHRRKTFVPRIIVDTNIWYQLGKDDVLFNKVKDKLTPTYNNLWEMSNTGKLHNRQNMVRNGIRKTILCSKRMVCIEPLRYLIKRANKKFPINMREYTKQMLNFTQKIANGYNIDEKQQNAFFCHVQGTKHGLDLIADDFNRIALECKNKIKSKNRHRNANTLSITINFLDYIARQATNNKFGLKRLPLKEYELLILVIDEFFKELELGESKWKRNDLFDIFNLAYVRRGDKYWTNDKKWIDIIKRVDCDHYLFDPDTVQNFV